MKGSFRNIILVCVICTAFTNVTRAYWTRVTWDTDGGGTKWVGPEPVAPPEAYGGIVGWESRAGANGVGGYAWAMVDTRARQDGFYNVYDPNAGLVYFQDCQSQTSGHADANGLEFKGFRWVGYEPPDPACEYFRVARCIQIRSQVFGDADNGALTAGVVRLDGNGSGHVNVNEGGISAGLDINYKVDVDFAEGGDWEPELTVVIGESPAIELTWDHPVGWLDDSFYDYEKTPYNYNRTVTATSFGVDATAYVTLTEIRSSNNATQAKVDMDSASGYQTTDSDFYGL